MATTQDCWVGIFAGNGIKSVSPHNGKQMVTDEITISCTVKSGYQFSHWDWDGDLGSGIKTSRIFSYSPNGHDIDFTAVADLIPPPSFTLSPNENTITVSISGANSFYKYFRIFYRKTSESESERIPSYDADPAYIRKTSNFNRTISGLDYDTSYTVNVAYSSTGEQITADWTFLGAKRITTDKEQTETNSVKIYHNGAWKDAVPYIYCNTGDGQGYTWHQVTAYVYNNGWKKCT